MNAVRKISESTIGLGFFLARSAESVVRSTKSVVVSSVRGTKSVASSTTNAVVHAARSAKVEAQKGYRIARRNHRIASQPDYVTDYDLIAKDEAGDVALHDTTDAEACFNYCEGDPS